MTWLHHGICVTINWKYAPAMIAMWEFAMDGPCKVHWFTLFFPYSNVTSPWVSNDKIIGNDHSWLAAMFANKHLEVSYNGRGLMGPMEPMGKYGAPRHHPLKVIGFSLNKNPPAKKNGVTPIAMESDFFCSPIFLQTKTWSPVSSQKPFRKGASCQSTWHLAASWLN